MAGRKDRKNVYVLKNTPNEVEKKHKELQSKSVYLLKADDHVVTKYSDTVYDFIDSRGLFLMITQDKGFFQYFRKALYKELRIEQERILQFTSETTALTALRKCTEQKLKPLVFVESIIDEHPSLSLFEEIKTEFKNQLVVVLMNDSDEQKVAQFVEAGADNFITKPVSTNMLIEKIANTLVPPDEIGKKVREGKERLRKIEFALAYGVAREILEMKPGSPAGLLIMGDALKGLSKRNDALKMYIQASENADMYLEPLKKIVQFYKEDEDTENVLKYLLRIDELSPLHAERKRELGEIYYDKGDMTKAADYFEQTVRLVHKQKRKDCVEMAKDFADRIFEKKDSEAVGLLTLLTRLSRFYHVDQDWSWYNRLGMLLRRSKDWKGAIKAYLEASALAPQDGSILFNLGMAYVEGKDFGNAAQKFERAARLSPELYKDNIDAAYLMGQVFMRANQKPLARKMFEHVHNVNPNHKKVAQLLESVKS